MSTLRDDASTKTGSDPKVTGYYGFKDDPNQPNGTRYYSYLSYAAGYTGGGPAIETTITSGPSGTVNGASTNRFEFSSDKPDATFECSLDGAAYSTCASGQEYPNLYDGSHTFLVRATSAGVTDPTPASQIWKVDATAPTVSSVSPTGTGVRRGTSVTATFSEAVKNVGQNTFMLVGPGGAQVPATVSYDSASRTAKLVPSQTLGSYKTYTATVKDATDSVMDQAGNPLDCGNGKCSWSFTTGRK